MERTIPALQYFCDFSFPAASKEKSYRKEMHFTVSVFPRNVLIIARPYIHQCDFDSHAATTRGYHVLRVSTLIHDCVALQLGRCVGFIGLPMSNVGQDTSLLPGYVIYAVTFTSYHSGSYSGSQLGVRVLP